MRVPARPGRSTPGLRERLRTLSSRFHGAQAIQLRTDPIPHAYRVFYRHVGLDPDTERTPVEAAVVDRLMHGGFRSRGLVEDALLIAVAETGVPLWALDDATLEGALGIRLAGEPSRSAAGSTRTTRARAASWWPTTSARWPSCSPTRRPATRRARAPRRCASSPSRSRACRRSTSRRRSGWRRKRSTALVLSGLPCAAMVAVLEEPPGLDSRRSSRSTTAAHGARCVSRSPSSSASSAMRS